MAAQDDNDVLFDAMLKVAVADAYKKEITEIPADEYLDDYKPSPTLDKRIGEIIRHQRRKARVKLIFKHIGKAAAILCILLTVSSIVLMSVGATRNAIFNAIINWQEKYTEIGFSETSEANSLYRPAYLPEGFSENSVSMLGAMTMIIYENKDGIQIYFNQAKAGTDTTYVDNENTDAYEIKISDDKAYLFKGKTEQDSNMLIWETNSTVFRLTSVIDSEELVRIGESLEK